MPIILLATDKDGECVDCEDFTSLCPGTCDEIKDDLPMTYTVDFRDECFIVDEGEPDWNQHTFIVNKGFEVVITYGTPVGPVYEIRPAAPDTGCIYAGQGGMVTDGFSSIQGVAELRYVDGYGWRLTYFLQTDSPLFEETANCICINGRAESDPIGDYLLEDDERFCPFSDDPLQYAEVLE